MNVKTFVTLVPSKHWIRAFIRAHDVYIAEDKKTVKNKDAAKLLFGNYVRRLILEEHGECEVMVGRGAEYLRPGWHCAAIDILPDLRHGSGAQPPAPPGPRKTHALSALTRSFEFTKDLSSDLVYITFKCNLSFFL